MATIKSIQPAVHSPGVLPLPETAHAHKSKDTYGTSTIQSLSPKRQEQDSQKSVGLWQPVSQFLSNLFWGTPSKPEPLLPSDDETLFGKQLPLEPLDRKSTHELFDEAMRMLDHWKELAKQRKDPLQQKAANLMRKTLDVAKLRWEVSQRRITQGTADLTKLVDKQRELRKEWLELVKECEEQQDKSWIINQMKDWFQAAGFFATGTKLALAGTQFAIPLLVVGGLAFFSNKVSDAGLRIAARCYSTVTSIGDTKEHADKRARQALEFLKGVSQTMLSAAMAGAGGAAIMRPDMGGFAGIQAAGTGGLTLAGVYSDRVVGRVKGAAEHNAQEQREQERQKQEYESQLSRAQDDEIRQTQDWATILNRQQQCAEELLRKVN